MDFKANRCCSKPRSRAAPRVAVCIVSLMFFLGGGCGREEPPPVKKPKIVVPIKKSLQPQAQPKAPVQQPVEVTEKKTEQINPQKSPDSSLQEDQQASPQKPKPTQEVDTQEKKGSFYRVQKGETLFEIAQRKDVYGDPLKWCSLFRHNMAQLGQLQFEKDFERKPLDEGVELRYVTPQEASRNLTLPDKGSWVVNVKSSKTMDQVVVPALTLMKSGYHVYMTRAKIKGEDWIRLRVGFFKNRSEAVAEGKRITSILNSKGIWVAKVDKGELEEFGGY